jgi:DNA-binding MarR family transcriptional regulator
MFNILFNSFIKTPNLIALMSFYEMFQKLELLSRLISNESTGTVEEIASRLNVSPRTVKSMLNQLRNLGHGEFQILFCRKRLTFFFLPNVVPDFKVLKKKK